MRNRLLLKVQKVGQKKSKVFCAFLTLGYPSLKATKRLILKLEQAGTDVIELGFPFSDPLADGPTIQYSSEMALRKGIRIDDAFKLVRQLRQKGCAIPIIFFSYLNPIFHYGFSRFVRNSRKSGFDGLIVPDMPPEEEPELQRACLRKGLVPVFLLAPTTEEGRAAKIARHSRGFVYYVSLRGVTGARKVLPRDIKTTLRRFRKVVKKPILVGFGVSSPGQGADLAEISEGVIVGSAIIDHIRRAGGRLEPAVKFVGRMVRSVKGGLS